MTSFGGECEAVAARRPIGPLDPPNERAVRALAALREGRIKDAAAHVEAMSATSGTGSTWRLLIQGLVAVEQGELSRAESLLAEACAVAVMSAVTSQEGGRTGAWRLAARSMHHLGWVFRRRDRLKEAVLAHQAAHTLREEYGSHEELWETAVNLGLDFDVARDHESGQRWHRAALHAADRVSLEPDYRRAVAWTHLASSCTESGKHDEAVHAARSAREAWRSDDIGAATAPRADLALGTALLRQGQALFADGDESATQALEEAVEWLTTAHDDLLAFGDEHVEEAVAAREQCDFARRLLSAPMVEPNP